MGWAQKCNTVYTINFNLRRKKKTNGHSIRVFFFKQESNQQACPISFKFLFRQMKDQMKKNRIKKKKKYII